MKKNILVLLLSLFVCVTMTAQSSMSIEGAEKERIIQQITTAHNNLKSLQTDFVQEKKSAVFTDAVVQKGIMYYTVPSKLRWEYTTPSSLAVIFNNDKLLIKNDKGVINNPNKMLGELGKIIINTLNGKNLVNNPNFIISYQKDKNAHICVLLNPVNKRMKEMYKSIKVILDEKNHLATSVQLEEKNGDTTIIRFSNKKINNNIADKLFTE